MRNKNRRKRWTRFRHRIMFAFLRPFFWLYLRIRYGFRYKVFPLEHGPAIILFNHATDLDPFMVSMSLKGANYFIATDDIFSLGFLTSLISYFVAPIPKSKAINDIQTIKTCLQVVREGGRIALAPEGNRTFTGNLCHINKAILKFIRFLNVPLVLYNITGGFGVHPRFSPYLRSGKMKGRVTKVLSPEEYKALTDDELYKIIIDNLKDNEILKGNLYKSSRRAEYLESLFYVCPICHEFSTLHSKKNNFYCDNCGLNVEYREDLTFGSSNPKFKFKNVNDWYEFQNNFVLGINPSAISFIDEDVRVRKVVRGKRKKDVIKGQLTINSNLISVSNKQGKLEFLLNDIYSIALLGQNKFNIYINDEIFQFKSDNRFNGLKYMHFYHLIRIKKEGINDAFLGI